MNEFNLNQDSNNGADGDGREVLQQGADNEARQKAIVMDYFFRAGNLFLGADDQTRQPISVGNGIPSVGINPNTGEIFRVGMAGADTAKQTAGTSPTSLAPPDRGYRLIAFAVLAFLTFKVIGS